MKLRSLILFSILCLTSCSDFSLTKRGPSSTALDIRELFEGIRDDVAAGTNSASVCKEGLKARYEQLFNIRSHSINIESYSSEDLRRVIEASFETRIDIAAKLRALTIKTELDAQCLGSVQDIVRALRYAEDYLVEVLVTRDDKEALTREYINFKGESPYLLVNPKYRFRGAEDLKGGDIILSRGNAYSSAAIARIGERDMQFSHLSFVYEDESGKLHTAEAHIEIGNVVAPFQAHIDEKNARSVVFRYKDPELAAKASELIYKRVQKAQAGGKNIEYDFSMNLAETKRLFCSEVVHAGFKMATGNQVDVPRFKTKFTKGMIPFLQTLGIEINEANVSTFETFAPGDIQFDSDFEMVAEWRNPARMKDNRQKDAILTMLFKWMEDHSYRFRPTAGMGVKARTAWLARRVPMANRGLKDDFPMNMTVAQLKLFFVLDEVAAPIHEYLTKEQEKRKVPMTPLEMYEILEMLRQSDLKNYRLARKYKAELDSIGSDREDRNSYRARQLRKLLRAHTPLFHELYRPNKI